MASENNLPIYWGPDYVLDSGVETRTKSGPLAKILIGGEVPGVDLIAPLPITRDELLEIHDEHYIDRLVNFERPELTRSIFASTGGVRDALDAMFEHGKAGSLSSGLHHAKRDHDEGLCYINGLALAALRAISKHGVKKLLYLIPIRTVVAEHFNSSAKMKKYCLQMSVATLTTLGNRIQNDTI